MATKVKSSQSTHPNILRIKGRSDVHLRRINRDDVPELYDVMLNNRKHLQQHLQTGDLTEKGVGEGVEWMLKKMQKGSYLQYRIIVGEKIIGSVLLYDIDKKAGIAKTGIWVEKKSEGQGFARAAMQRLMDYGFEKMGLKKVLFDIDPANERSERLAQSLGGNVASDVITEKLENGRNFTYRVWDVING